MKNIRNYLTQLVEADYKDSGEKTKIYYDMIWPNGSETTDASAQEWSGGSTGELCFKAKTAGTFFVTFYDEKENEMGSGTVEIIE